MGTSIFKYKLQSAHGKRLKLTQTKKTCTIIPKSSLGRAWGPLATRWILEDVLRGVREVEAAKLDGGLTIPGCLKLCIEVYADSFLVFAKTTAAEARGARAVAEALRKAGLVRGSGSEVLVNGFRPGDAPEALTEDWGSIGATVAQDDGTLKVRGYVGLPLFGKTQIWTRAPKTE